MFSSTDFNNKDLYQIYEAVLNGGGGTYTASEGLSAVGNDIQLGQSAAGSGAADFTANRFIYLNTFGLILGGSASNELYRLSGSGLATFTNSSLGATQTDLKGILFTNSTAAAVGAQQVSPAIIQEGLGWATGAANSQSIRFRNYILPIQGVTNPSGTWLLQHSVNGGAYTTAFSVHTNGEISFPFNGVKFGVNGTTTNYFPGACAIDAIVGFGGSPIAIGGYLNLTGTAVTLGTSHKTLNILQTWNTTGTPTALFLNVTDTASNAASLLMDLQKDGVSQLNLSKDGNITLFGSYTSGAPTAGTAAPWKLGSKVTVAGPLALSTTDYIEIEVGSSGLVKLAIVN